MSIHFRFYEGESDMLLQYSFWEKVTSELPYAWKMTKSPLIFKEKEGFHRKSRCFAFNGNELVGYMSFTGSREFVSLGYPWVKDGYEEIRDLLFDKVYGFASSTEYGAKLFAQRFREQWVEQIHYFEEKGFHITNKSPLLGTELTEEHGRIEQLLGRDCYVEEGFSFEKWEQVATHNNDVTESQLTMMKEYYGSVDFDFSVVVEHNRELTAVVGITMRKDTSYAEVIAFTIQKQYEHLTEHILRVVMNEVIKRDGKTITISERYVAVEYQKSLGLKLVTSDMMMVKEI